MELCSKRQDNEELTMDKPTLSPEDRLAQQQFAQSIPIIERDSKPHKTTPPQQRRP